MNRRWHLVIGGIAFLLWLTFLDRSGSPVPYPWLSGILLTAAGAVVPDIIEPAFTGNHRGIFHSRGALRLLSGAFILAALLTVTAPPFTDRMQVYLASCFLLGYLSHLLADATTPRGLPR